MVSRRREQSQVLRDLMTSLAVCNNVTPVDAGPFAAELDKNEEVDIRELGRRSSFVKDSREPRNGSLVDKPEDQGP